MTINHLFLLLAALVAVCTAANVPSTVMTKTFETVHPEILGKSRHARDVHPDSFDVKIATNDEGDAFTLRLTLNSKLIAPQFASIYFEEDGKEIQVTEQPNCFYHGEVLEHPEWMVAMDSCQGLRGTFGDLSNNTERYNIEPLNEKDTSLEQPHALYQADESEDEGDCGTTHEHTVDLENPLNLDEKELKRARRQASSGATRIVELAFISDNRQYRHYSNNVQNTVNRALALANVADRIYRQLGVRIVVSHSTIWSRGDRVQFNASPDVALTNFRTYMRSIFTNFNSDAIVLLTGNDFTGSTVGIAYVNTMCSSLSIGLVQDRHSSAQSTGSTLAHELGHLFNMQHDTSACSCTDPSRRCVMAAVSAFPAPERWSSCSSTTINAFISSRGSCLNNEPASVVGTPTCGNGIREGNEVCDCGSPEECTDPCCNARTCRLAAGAQCSQGECCSNTCQFLGSNSVCRASTGDCDLPETCSGRSADCPVNTFHQDGSTCNSGQAYCFSGECKTYNAQCQKHFRTNKGADECFTGYNTGGNYFGNCGTDGTNFVRCASSDVMCGQLFCQEGSFQNTVNSVYILTVSAYVTANRRAENCNAFTPPANSDIISPGLVDDGIKCGSGKMCYEQRCRSISDLVIPQCPNGTNGRVCSGNGACNNRGECSCNSGFSGRTCTSSSTLVNECLTNNGGCSQTCVDTATSRRCECRSGYQLASNRRTCLDVNECRGQNGCAHRCANTQGSYTCSCNAGYRLGSDGRSCNLIPTAPPTTAATTAPPTTAATTAPPPTSPTSCGGRLTSTSGSFQTPGWPSNYPQRNFECEWTIDVPVTGYAVKFNIDTTAYGINGRSPCSRDYLQFFDGLSSGASSLHKLCKFDNPGAITASSSEARVVFVGSRNNARPSSRVGARVTYTLTDIDECSLGTHGCQQQCSNTAGSYTCSCSSGYTLDSNGRTCTQETRASLCGGTLTGSSGTFQTPGYPTSYPKKSFECEWTITAPASSNRVYFSIDPSRFGINGRSPCRNDYLEFFDGATGNGVSLAKVCGLAGFYPNSRLPAVLTTSSSARIIFRGSADYRSASRIGARVNYYVI